MLKRKLVFQEWASIAGRPEFVPRDVAVSLRDAIAGDRDFAIIDNDGVITAVEVVDIGTHGMPVNMRVLALRHPDDRPFKWDADGSISPIHLLDNEYPADVTHVSIWPNGICAHDYGGHLPRLSRLSFFLRRKMGAHVTFSPLYREDMFEKLKSMAGQLRSVEIAMTKPEWMQGDRGAFGTLLPSVAGEKTPSVRVALGMGRYGPRDAYLDDETEEEVFSLAEQAGDLLTSMVIKGRNRRNNRVETVNLLQERIQAAVEFRRSATVPSMPNPDEVFFTLDQTYKDFKQQGLLESALRGRLMRD